MAASPSVVKRSPAVNRLLGSSSLLRVRYLCLHAFSQGSSNTEYCQGIGSSSGETKASLSVEDIAENSTSTAASRSGYEAAREWVGGGTCSRGPNSVCFQRIRSLCRMGNVEKAHELIKALIEKKADLKSEYFNFLIAAYSKAGRFQDARDVLEDMHRFGLRPPRASYHAVMDCYFKCRRVFEALDMFDRMRKDQWQPNEVTWSIIAYGLCKTGHAEEVKASLLEGCGKPGVVSTSVCNAVLESSYKSGDFHGAEELGKRVLSGFCRPNSYTYAILIRGHCAQGKVDEAQELFGEMKRAGCKPILACYGSLIYVLCTVGRVQEAYDMFKDMLACDIAAEGGAFCEKLLNLLIQKGMFDEAMEACKSLVAKGSTIGSETLALLLERLSNANRCSEVKPFLETVTRPDAEGALSEKYLNLYIQSGMMDEAMRACECMVAKSRLIDSKTLVLVLEGLSNAGRLDEAKPFLERVMRRGGARGLGQALHALERREAIRKGCSPIGSPNPLKGGWLLLGGK